MSAKNKIFQSLEKTALQNADFDLIIFGHDFMNELFSRDLFWFGIKKM